MTTAGIGRAVIVGASLAGTPAAFSLRESGCAGDIVLVGAETAPHPAALADPDVDLRRLPALATAAR